MGPSPLKVGLEPYKPVAMPLEEFAISHSHSDCPDMAFIPFDRLDNPKPPLVARAVIVNEEDHLAGL